MTRIRASAAPEVRPDRAAGDADGCPDRAPHGTLPPGVAAPRRFAAEAFEALFLNSPDAVFYADPEGTVFAANPAACALTGYTEQELCAGGRDLVEVPENPPRPSVLAEIRRTGTFRRTITYRRKDGSTFPGDVTAAVFCTSAGEQRCCVIVRDATERSRDEAAAREAVRSETSRSERQRISDVMHDAALQQLFCASLELDQAALQTYRMARAAQDAVPFPAPGQPQPTDPVWQRVHEQIESAAEYLRTAIRELRVSLDTAVTGTGCAAGDTRVTG